MTVDVSTKKQTAQPNVAIVVIVVLVVLWFVSGRQTPDPAPTPKTPNAMVIVPAVGQASSMLVDRWAKKNGFEVRRYSETADLSTAEPYLQKLFDQALKNAPCAVVSKNGELQVIPIDDDFLAALDGVK
jgi:hypothetical protein|tara:strand:- start:182 stop:568 length:387 start_codon:yes stop_codon:yes gene_type:complete